jgi:hypothetical protein
MKHTLSTVLAILLTAAGSADARETGAHVHGAAKMQLAVDGNTLELELISPLDSLLGFEHAPRTGKQRNAVHAMTEKFRKPESLFVPTAAARCTAGPAQLTSPVTNGDMPPKERKQEDGHGELEAVITFRCESPSALKDLDVKLFEAFPQLHRLQVQIVGPRGQSAATLTPKRRVLSW